MNENINFNTLYYVNSITGNDVLNDGLSKSLPFKTLEKAISSCSNIDDGIYLENKIEINVPIIIPEGKTISIVGDFFYNPSIIKFNIETQINTLKTNFNDLNDKYDSYVDTLNALEATIIDLNQPLDSYDLINTHNRLEGIEDFNDFIEKYLELKKSLIMWMDHLPTSADDINNNHFIDKLIMVIRDSDKVDLKSLDFVIHDTSKSSYKGMKAKINIDTFTDFTIE